MSLRPLIVAIDGPSGAGKSTVSKLLAERLGYTRIDTGAMYRSVALMASRKGITPEQDAPLQDLCASLEIRFVKSGSGDRILANGEDVSEAIRAPEISLLTSAVAANPVVRDALVDLQRRAGEDGGVVLEGRDIGTVVFPKADIKFFLSASAEERGRRRYEELKAKGLEVDLQQTIAEVIARDENDSNRAHSPLRQAEDAILIDSTGVDLDGVVGMMLGAIAERCSVDGGKGEGCCCA